MPTNTTHSSVITSLFGLVSIVLGACSRPAINTNSVVATVETQPVASLDDAADDPAIWINRADPTQSLILGTDKKAGLAVYDLSGSQVQFLPVGRVNNVDVREGLQINGTMHTIAAASQRDQKAILLWTIDPAGGMLREIPGGPIATGLGEPYGICLSRTSAAGDGRLYVFVNGKDGRIEQYLLTADQSDSVHARLVRTLQLKTQPEGMVADEGQGVVFIGEEVLGVWRFPLDPDAGTQGTLIASAKPNGELTADVEGIALVIPQGAKPGSLDGWLIVSSQGSNQYAIYDRKPPHAFRTIFSIVDSASVDGTQETDGLDVTTTSLGPLFPFGLLVVQDGDNNGLPQNFKLVPWEFVERLIQKKK